MVVKDLYFKIDFICTYIAYFNCLICVYYVVCMYILYLCMSEMCILPLFIDVLYR